MPKISTSLAIAFAVHILIVVVSTFLIDKKASPLVLDTENAINVQFGSSSSSSGSYSKKSAIAPHVSTTLSSDTNPSSVSTTQGVIKASGQSDSSKSGNGTGLGDGSGNGSGNETYDFENSAVSYKEPIYPRLAIKRELQGTLRIRVRVSTEGKPTNTEILKSSGYEILDKAALEAVSFWQFQPKAFFYFVEKTIVFQLKN